jgi:succinate dehydrogenase/fumarate reductase flavoprotein subunit
MTSIHGQAFDIVVAGSGAAGLTAALFAAKRGASVLVMEKSGLLGGTTAISGGQIWVPNHKRMRAGTDSPAAAKKYLQQVTMGEVDPGLLNSFVDAAPRMVDAIEQETGLEFAVVERPDYHSEWSGSRWGRSLEPLPTETVDLGEVATSIRSSPYRAPLTSAEIKAGAHEKVVLQRRERRQVTQGHALVAGLVRGCLRHKVRFATSMAVTDVRKANDGSFAVSADFDEVLSTRALVFASGGFEWNEEFKQAFLACPDEGAASPPFNTGDALRIGLRLGASVANMTQAWWSAAYAIPGETYDGRPLTRNIVRELALPGSILVNADGMRFVNEAASYNALGKAFQVFDSGRNSFPNRRAWLVFDDSFRQRYTVASVSPSAPTPDWFIQGNSLEELACKAGIKSDALKQTVVRFNDMARSGCDLDFGRGQAEHDQYHSDPSQPHRNLGPILQAPFFAVPIFLGNLGTKGGLRTDEQGHVMSMAGKAIEGLFACGNVAASWMGPGYPGAGGSLGPIMTAAYLCGNEAARVIGEAQRKVTNV